MLLKQNFYNNTILKKFITKKILNILLYNKVLVRSFELILNKQTQSTVLKSNMLKLIADNYYTFFYISGKKFQVFIYNLISLEVYNLRVT